MSDACRVRAFRAMAGAAGLGLALSAASFGQQGPVPAVPGSAPAAPVAWLISKGPHEIQVLIRDQSTNENVFRIERRPAGPGAWTLVTDLRLAQLERQTGHELPFTDQHLNENAEYHYRIRAGRIVNPAFSAWSTPVVLSGRTRLDPGPPATGFCTSAGPADCDATFDLSNGPRIKYYRSYALDQLRLTVTRVVLAVHGLSRNAQGTYNNVVGAATAADVRSETLVVAPLFGEDDWGEGWKAGDRSHDGLSSFAAADQLIMAMTDPNVFPNVREVVVTGHSAGGQFTQRYAATSSIESQRPGLKYRFVVANPSSYVYLNNQRPVASNDDQSSVRFGTPNRCSTYNEYKYGLQDRNRYASRLTADQIRDQYTRRHVVYLLGTRDTDTNSADLDRSCEAMVQGTQRLVRGRFYYRHMMQFFPDNRHRRVEVAGVGHSGSEMFNSANGREALFF